jgi:SAM-dependent methyltransferase
MDAEAIGRERDEIVARYGPWTAHNLRLADDVWTISPEPAGDEVKLRRVTQVVSDVLGGELAGARVLDLACLEGMYALELARRGADVVAVEGREANLEKARFAARVLGLEGIDFRQGDVRDVGRSSHGEFDVVLCLGILYHLDAPDVFAFVERLAEICRRALVVDTGVAVRPTETQDHAGHAYPGIRLVEHAEDSTAEERLEAVWSSLDNVTAFAPTRPALERLLVRSGFTSVYECHVPAEPRKEVGRVTLLALRGEPVGELLTPAPEESVDEVPERPPLARRLEASPARLFARHALPPALRARLRRALGAETRRH